MDSRLLGRQRKDGRNGGGLLLCSGGEWDDLGLEAELGADEVDDRAYNEGGDGGGGERVDFQDGEDAHDEAGQPGEPAGGIEARAAGPGAASQKIVHHHRAANGAEGGADNGENANEVASHAGDGENNADQGANADGDEGIDLGQGGFEAVGGNEG